MKIKKKIDVLKINNKYKLDNKLNNEIIFLLLDCTKLEYMK